MERQQCLLPTMDYDIFKKVEINFGVMPFLGDGEEAEYLIGGPAAS